MTKKLKKKEIYNLDACAQAEYIVSNFIDITYIKTDRIPMPLLDVLIILVHNPGYYNDYHHFFNQVKKHIKVILFAKGVKRIQMSTKSSLLLEHPLFNQYIGVHEPSLDFRKDEKQDKIPAFSNALLNWSYHDSTFDDMYN